MPDEAAVNERKKMMERSLEGLRETYASLPYPPVTGQILQEEIMLPSEDGVRLRTVMIRPVIDGKEAFPTVVQRSCYPNAEAMLRAAAEEYAKRGFACVYQFCRGTGGSEGKWEPNVNDRLDGLALMRWLDGQAWVECMGYQGASYLAFTGWVMADALPEKVKSLYLTVYGTDRHTSAYKDGLFRQDILTAWAMDNAGHPVNADYMKSAAFRPQVRVDEALWGGRLDWYRDWITNTSSTDPYWNAGFWKMLRDIPGKLRIPVYIGEGWYDHHLGSALNGYCALNPEIKRHSVLRIGPWNHSMRPAIYGHPEQKNGFGDEAANMLEWFEATLMRGEIPEGRVRLYMIGADEWREFPSFPVPYSEEKTFFLRQDGKLEEEPGSSGCLQYLYDPQNPVPSHGAESLFKTAGEIGSRLQPAENWREDILSFVSDPVDEPLDIVGRIRVRLQVSSDAEDTAFAVKVMEVFPSGGAYNIRNGITTLAYRNGAASRLKYSPGEIVTVEIECWDVARQIQKGSRLRVDITSSNFPEYAVHPNKAGVWSEIEETQKACQTVYFGMGTMSGITLPLMKGKKE